MHIKWSITQLQTDRGLEGFQGCAQGLGAHGANFQKELGSLKMRSPTILGQHLHIYIPLTDVIVVVIRG